MYYASGMPWQTLTPPTLSYFIEAGSCPFEYTKNGVSMKMSYSSAPIEVFDDPELARTWASRAFEAAVRAKGKSRKRV